MRPIKLTLAGKAILAVSLFVLTAISVDGYKYVVTSEFLGLSQKYAQRYERAHKIQMIRSEMDHAVNHAQLAPSSEIYQLHLAEELSRAYRQTNDVLRESNLIPGESQRWRELRTSIRKFFSPSVTGDIDKNYYKEIQATAGLAKELYDLEGQQLAAENWRWTSTWSWTAPTLWAFSWSDEPIDGSSPPHQPARSGIPER